MAVLVCGTYKTYTLYLRRGTFSKEQQTAIFFFIVYNISSFFIFIVELGLKLSYNVIRKLFICSSLDEVVFYKNIWLTGIAGRIS